MALLGYVLPTMKPTHFAALLLTLLASAHANAASNTSDHIAQLLRAPDPLVVDGELLDGASLRALYERREHRPLWEDAAADPARLQLIATTLADADSHGL